jgi:uncharacterized protein (TIGR03437 family)
VRKPLRDGCCVIALAIGIGALALQAQAQPSSTCSIAPAAVQSLSIERAVMPADTNSTFQTSLSADILASLAAGTKELRERLIYNPQANAVTSTVFLVVSGSPIPTPAGTDITSATVATYSISLDRTFTSCSPRPNVMFTGTVTSSAGGASAPNGIYNLIFSGTPAAISIGYTTDNPPRVSNVVTLFAGVAVSYSAAGSGTLTFAATPPAGQPAIVSVFGAASMLPDIAPNSFGTIVGSGLASTTDTWNSSIVNGALPTSLDGVSVMVGGSPAYISYVSPGQINFVAPQASSGPVSVTVKNSSGTSVAFTVTSSQYAPAIFAWPGNQAVATHQDFTFAAKPGTFAAASTTPAKPGETIILWCTGLGPTTPSTPMGMVVPSTPLFDTTVLPTATLNNSPVTVFGAALMPGGAAVYQVAIQVPVSIGTGDWPLQLSIGGTTSPVGLILSVQQ